MRRLLTVASLALASVVLTTVGAVAPASAAPPRNTLAVRGSAYIVDDEPWPANDQDGTHTLDLKSVRLPSGDVLEWSPCEDKEVTAYVRVRAYTYADHPGRIAVGVRVVLYEGKSCDSKDVADYEDISFDMAPGESVEKTINVKSREGISDDKATVTLKLTNWYTVFPDFPIHPALP